MAHCDPFQPDPLCHSVCVCPEPILRRETQKRPKRSSLPPVLIRLGMIWRSASPARAQHPAPPGRRWERREAGPWRRFLALLGARAAWLGCSSACSSCTAACSPAMRAAAPCTDTACSAAWPRPAWPAWTAASRVRVRARRGERAAPGEGSVAAAHTPRAGASAGRLPPCCAAALCHRAFPGREGVSCHR